eukprot:1197379-Amphidinium_carterae.1
MNFLSHFCSCRFGALGRWWWWWWYNFRSLQYACLQLITARLEEAACRGQEDCRRNNATSSCATPRLSENDPKNSESSDPTCVPNHSSQEPKKHMNIYY